MNLHKFFPFAWEVHPEARMQSLLLVLLMASGACTDNSSSPTEDDSSTQSDSTREDTNGSQSGEDTGASGSVDTTSSEEGETSASDESDDGGDTSETSGSSDETASSTEETQESSTTTASTAEDSTSTSSDTSDDVDPNVDPADVVVHIEDDLDMAKLQEYAQRYEAVSQDLWVASEGQQYVATLTLRDKTPDSGNNTVFISTGDIDTAGQSNPWCPGGALACVNWYRQDGPVMYVGGDIPSSVWGHEHGHFAFWMWEEYDEPRCSDCFMSAPATAAYCDDSNHVTGAQNHEKDDFEGSCWTIITKYYHPEWKRPNSGFDPSSLPPDFKLSIEDN